MVPQLHTSMRGGAPQWAIRPGLGPVWGHSDPVRHDPGEVLAGGAAGAGKVFLTMKVSTCALWILSALSAERANVVDGAAESPPRATGSDFQYLLGTAMRGVGLKPGGAVRPLPQRHRPVPVHRADLAGRGEGSMAPPMGFRRKPAPSPKGADGRWHAEAGARDAILALRKDPADLRPDGGRICQATTAASSDRRAGTAGLRRGTLCRPFPRPRRCLQADQAGGERSFHASAAAQFPAVAAANKSVFFHADGSAKSVREVYDWAMRQPGATDTVRAPRAGACRRPPQSGRMIAATAPDSEIQMLISGVMNWQPHSFFGGDTLRAIRAAGRCPFGPGLLEPVVGRTRELIYSRPASSTAWATCRLPVRPATPASACHPCR